MEDEWTGRVALSVTINRETTVLHRFNDGSAAHLRSRRDPEGRHQRTPSWLAHFLRDAVSMTEEETKRTLQALLDVAWQSIAASGWTRYQLFGRGALLASIHMLEGRSNSMDYITGGAGAALPAWLEAENQQL